MFTDLPQVTYNRIWRMLGMDSVQLSSRVILYRALSKRAIDIFIAHVRGYNLKG